MTKYLFALTDSLEKVLPKRTPREISNSNAVFLGESYSFQLAYTCENDDFGESDCCFRVDISTDFDGEISTRRVELVPSALPCHGTWDNNYLTTEPGLLPDLLVPHSADTMLKAVPMQWRALWIEAVPSQKDKGKKRKISLSVLDTKNNILYEKSLELNVLNYALPSQTIYHTEWFHADCLADYYKVPVFSEEHWRIIDNFMASAARHSVNLLLTPLFTPPLDTAKGEERTTIQLIGVTKLGEKYEFDFQKLHRWITLCHKNNIQNLEMSHLFTQWGAGFAPKIIASDENGIEIKMFGWHTAANEGEYPCFLQQFLPALQSFLKKENMLENVWFHISDEPTADVKASYSSAKKQVEAQLKGCKIIDTLSSYDFYKEGLVDMPIVCVDHIDPFIDAKISGLWTYYCTVQAIDVCNRFMAMPSARNRVLGVLMYIYKIEGFLHWGFNFYNSQRSVKHINPFEITDAGEAFPSGDPFLVYPAQDGTALESIRGMVLREALFDLRALTLLEAKTNRKTVMDMLTDNGRIEITFKHYPQDAQYFLNLRKKIAALL